MSWFAEHTLSLLVFSPLVWAILGLLIPTSSSAGKTVLKTWSLLGTIGVFLLSLCLLCSFSAKSGDFQSIESYAWLPELGVSYTLGIDGISLWLVLLTTFLMPIVVLGSFQAVEKGERAYYFLLLALESAMIGAFVALDVFLFYVFWEAMLIPMYFLIGVWGGKERIYASMKFFIYTLLGSLLMLVAIFWLAHQHSIQFGHYSTLISDWTKLKIAGGSVFLTAQNLLFLAFALAFAIKVPLFPLHTWLPDAHVQAPTSGSVILAAVLLKMGGYGFLRLAFPLFPDAVSYFQIPFMILSAIAIVYGAWVAMVQTDIKKLVAYSSVSHMGYVVLGLFAFNTIAVSGALYQMLNHGISTGALFLLVGMVYERRHTREISQFGGIAKVMPIFAVVLMMVTLSSVALPGTNGFVGEFLILLGAWKANAWLTLIAGLGVVFGAVYMLWMFQRVMLGGVTHGENRGLKDLSFREIAVMAPLIIAIFAMGWFPNVFLSRMQPSIDRLISPNAGVQSTAVALAPNPIRSEDQ